MLLCQAAASLAVCLALLGLQQQTTQLIDVTVTLLQCHLSQAKC